MASLRKRLFVVLVTIVAMAVVALWFYSQSTQPPEVVRFSVDPSVIKQGENATLTVIVKNFDLKELRVEYRFKVSHRVSIYEGAEELLPRTDSQYTFNYTLQATIPSETRVFVVVGALEEGISSVTYPISLSVYFDEEELPTTWSDLTLTVEE